MSDNLAPIPPDQNSSASNAESHNTGDPLASLYKMSTTAGLGTQEYVAINITSVVALIFGLASALALLAPIWLILPLAGVFAAILALVQIRNSNGTQSGKIFAWGGMILSILLAALVGANVIKDTLTTRSDQREIAGLIQRLGDQLKDKQFNQAYSLFSERFRIVRNISLPQFTERWKLVEELTQAGNITSFTWNGLLQFETDPQSNTRVAAAMAVLNFQKASSPGRATIIFRKYGNQWYIEDIPSVFPPPQENAPRR